MSLFDPAAVRAWARSAGHDVPERGRLAEKWELLYFEAGAPPLPVEAPVLVELPVERAPRHLAPHAYDPRPALLSGDAVAHARYWNIESTRARWTVADLMAMLDDREPAAA